MINNEKKEDPPLISIIIATFNAGAVIRECLTSIQQSAPADTEIIIMDGRSTDDTLPILQAAGVRKMTSAHDEGIYDALNKGILQATGKWLYFLGADDRLLPGFGDLATKLKDKKTIYYGDTQPIFLSDKPIPYHLIGGPFTKYKLAKYPVNHQSVIYPAAVFKKYKYCRDYRVFADYALNIRVWGDDDFRQQYYPIAIASYNMTGFSSSVVDFAFKKDKESLIREYLGTAVWIRYCLKRLKKRWKGERWH